MNESTTAHVKRVINASIDRVFEAWTDPEQLKEWHAPAGVGVPVAESENQVGGKRHITMKIGEDLYELEGEYKEYDAPNKLVYSWTDPQSIVTVLFKTLGDDSTEVEVTQTNVGDDGGAQDGWEKTMDQLPTFLGK